MENKSLYSSLFQKSQSSDNFALSEIQLADIISFQQAVSIDFYRSE